MSYFRIEWIPKKTENDGTVSAWVFYKADSKESAMERLKKDPMYKYDCDKGIESLKIEELSVDDYIAEMEKRNRLHVKKFYMHNHYNVKELSIKEYVKIKRVNDKSHEQYLNALFEVSSAFDIHFRSERELDLEKISVKTYLKFIKKAIAADVAENYEEVDRLFAKMPQKKSKRRIPTWY